MFSLQDQFQVLTTELNVWEFRVEHSVRENDCAVSTQGLNSFERVLRVLVSVKYWQGILPILLEKCQCVRTRRLGPDHANITILVRSGVHDMGAHDPLRLYR